MKRFEEFELEENDNSEEFEQELPKVEINLPSPENQNDGNYIHRDSIDYNSTMPSSAAIISAL